MSRSRLLDVATAIFAFLAAFFRFKSAAGQLPRIVMYWGRTPDIDPFYLAMKNSALMNTIAALCSGVSAGLFALNIIFRRNRRCSVIEL
jgi:hypothetical protein